MTKLKKTQSLVGLLATIPGGDCQVRFAVEIVGKIDDSLYLVQCRSALDGSPNVIRIVPISEMHEWRFYSDGEILGDNIESWCEFKRLRYDFDLKPKADRIAELVRICNKQTQRIYEMKEAVKNAPPRDMPEDIFQRLFCDDLESFDQEEKRNG